MAKTRTIEKPNELVEFRRSAKNIRRRATELIMALDTLKKNDPEEWHMLALTMEAKFGRSLSCVVEEVKEIVDRADSAVRARKMPSP